MAPFQCDKGLQLITRILRLNYYSLTSNTTPTMFGGRSRKFPKKARDQDVTQAGSSLSSSDSESGFSASNSAPTLTPGTSMSQDMPTGYSARPLGTSSGPSATTPHPSTSQDHSRTWANLKSLAKALNPTGPVKTILDELVECTQLYERVSDGKEEYRLLRDQLEDIFKDMEPHLSASSSIVTTSSVKNICSSIQQEIVRVKKHQEIGKLKRPLEAGEVTDNILSSYRLIHTYLLRLSLNVNLSALQVVDELSAENRLKALFLAPSARYNSAQSLEVKRGKCTLGTRAEVFAHISGWLHSNLPGYIYWLNGMAGTGKTTIAYSLCVQLDNDQRLAASFFGSRLLPECRNVNFVIPSIAYQFARFSHPFKFALLEVLKEHPDVHTHILHAQFDALIVKPLTKCRDSLPLDLVVVIDALDECDNKDGTSSVLDVLLTQAGGLPVKFFISSRPEPAIRDHMTRPAADRATSQLVLHELNKRTVQADIETYVRTALGPMDPSDQQIKTLAERAGILFIYAATVVRFIAWGTSGQNPRSRRRMDIVLNMESSSGNEHKEVDDLYATILKEALDDPTLDDSEKKDITLVLYTVICAREPLTIPTLSGLLNMDSVDRVDAALSPLWSVLHVSESNQLVTTLHQSFPDYMLDPTRSKVYHCDRHRHNHFLAQLCFDRIECTQPSFNICGLDSSYTRDEEVTGLDRKVNETISTGLFYACQYWAAHLITSDNPSESMRLLGRFLTTHLLIWLEIMNLKKCLDKGIEIMRSVEDWALLQGYSNELLELAHDAWRFTVAIALNPICQSTPHIYISGLPFWPRSNPIAKHYATRMRNMIRVNGQSSVDKEQLLLAKWNFGKTIWSCAFSPDGAQLALCVGPGIHVVDPFSGRKLFDPLEGHDDIFFSVAYSSDGTQIVSVSPREIIYIWDSQSGKLLRMLDPLEYAQPRAVLSVEFSPDITTIASGSIDGSVRIWNIEDGRLLGLYRGSQVEVTFLRYSPNGTCIAFCCNDNTIRVWNVQNGQLELGPLEGPGTAVQSIGYSPDGAYLASGSDNGTICIWNTQSGAPILEQSDTDEIIISIEYSPEGARIAAATRSGVFIHDALSGQLLLGPLNGHTDWLTFARFSPDGAQVLSGSPDQYMYVWDVQNRSRGPHRHEKRTKGTPPLRRLPDDSQNDTCPNNARAYTPPTPGRELVTTNPRLGHHEAVSSAVFSPDGKQIMSGSWDGAICAWDSQTGRMTLGPLTLKGPPTDSEVTSVDYSPEGTFIVSGSFDCAIRVWDTTSGQLIHEPFKRHSGLVSSVRYSPNGSLIASGSIDMTVCVWNPKFGHLASVSPKHGPVTSVEWSPDGTQIVSGSSDGSICIWDIQGKTVPSLAGFGTHPRLKIIHKHSILSVGYSPDGIRIVSGSTDMAICVWDAQSGQMVIGPLMGHTASVLSVAYSCDNSFIASGSEDKNVHIWDAHTGDMTYGPLQGHVGPVTSVDFSPDGAYVVSGSRDKTIRVWDLWGANTVSNRLPDAIQWEMNKDGWVTDERSRLLVWVPPHLRNLLMRSKNSLIISQEGCVCLEFGDAYIGEAWAKCYDLV
ncbi:unnamed protein product [Rhizoctonia solani]|uniref:Nephrocystin 3-like N-terminal domain-containing protein n=1 Tax=Rhizoctonia solani TaxID=456999 RepID=A0A8H3C816_9AGAM|nr:unnamed protein product [Rhizoctonia solani]